MNAPLSYTMPAHADITVESPRRQTLLVVECKVASESTAEDATALRRNLLGDGYLTVPDTAFFMLVFPTAFYLWERNCGLDSSPTLTAPAKPLLREYLGARIADKIPWPFKESVELGISFWLRDLAGGIRKPDPSSDADQMMVKSGLYERMKGADVRTDVAL